MKPIVVELMSSLASLLSAWTHRKRVHVFKSHSNFFILLVRLVNQAILDRRGRFSWKRLYPLSFMSCAIEWIAVWQLHMTVAYTYARFKLWVFAEFAFERFATVDFISYTFVDTFSVYSDRCEPFSVDACLWTSFRRTILPVMVL